ncbi:glycosyltransferase family 2 protein [uncultured Sphingomonas sp.]|uniref:glycosyltransferase family 2 protein n=1 Tax=uncultured Sphingomonas sp. TaxID=158754 RepID=UPI0035CB0BB2
MSIVRIDVLIPAYNVAPTIESAVRSILDQTVRDIRVIVVDDGSTDDTAAIVARLAAEDDRITVLRQANGGIVDALNNGLALCDAELIARHDGDDLAYPDRFEKQTAYLDAHPDCIAVGANARHIDAMSAPIGVVTAMGSMDTADAAWFPAREPYLMHPLLLIRRDALVAAGGYRYVFHAEDADLYWRLGGCGRLHNLPDVLADYRIHAGSVTGKSVLNGRVGAVNAQLAALSSERRRGERPDLTFPRERLDRFVEAQTTARMIAVAEEELDGSERARLSLATAAKLIELVNYRPYELDGDDWRFVTKSIKSHASLLTPENAQELHLRQVWYVAKLMSRGRLKSVLRDVPKSLLFPVASHLIRGKIDKVKRRLARSARQMSKAVSR